MRPVLIGLVFAIAFNGQSVAKSPTLIGSWFVNIDKDAFSDETKALALTPDEEKSFVIGIRCINKEQSIIVLPGNNIEDPFIKGVPYNVKLRVDKGYVDSLTGISLQEKGVEIEMNQDTFKKIEGSNSFALRFTTEKSDSNIDIIFSPHSTKLALAGVKSACGFN